MLEPTVRTQRTMLTLAFLLLVALTPGAASAESLTLAWDANPESDVVGYYVFIGTASGVYSTIADVGNTTSYTFPAAAPGSTYYLTVAAYVAGPVVGEHAPEVVASVGGAPTLSNPGSRTSAQYTALTLTLSATDPDNDPLTFNAYGLPPGLSLNSATGVISGTPTTAGAFNVSVSASDPSANVASQYFVWTVMASDTAAPTIGITTPTSGAAYSTSSAFVTLSGTATDDIGVTSVAWANSRGGSGTAAGTANWSVVIPLQTGSNVLTMTAADATSKSSTATVTVTLELPPLQLTAMTADVAAPQKAGTTVTFTATASGGMAPYQFKWLLFDGVSWSVTQEWSASNTFRWTPLKANSNYQVRVWARSAGSLANAPDNNASSLSMAFPIASGKRRGR